MLTVQCLLILLPFSTPFSAEEERGKRLTPIILATWEAET
jgi:hypothetical protein